jgi:hypothetical protein
MGTVNERKRGHQKKETEKGNTEESNLCGREKMTGKGTKEKNFPRM